MHVRTRRHVGVVTFFATVVMLGTGSGHAQQGSQGLAEDKLIRMVELKLKPEAIVSVIQKQGLGFTVDAAVVERLEKAKAPAAVVEAVRKAGEPKPEATGGQAITYQDIVDLLGVGVKSTEIVERLKQSPTTFTLSKDQTDELKRLGASEILLTAMGSVRTSVGTASELNNLAILFDCSGSMSEMTSSGRTKMDAARLAAINLIKDVPEGVRVAFVVYGQSREQGCKATQVIRKLEPLDEKGRDSLIATIGQLQPVGSTPISLALRVAGL
ncbi:vWA domain-containing protein, partial [Singulisphaera rosea]